MTTNTIEKKGFLYPAMFRGLIEAAIFTNEERLCEEAETEYNHQPAYQGDWQLDKASISIGDFAPSAIAYLEDLCREFESAFPEFCINPEEHLLIELRESTVLEFVGHDLWMTTCGHGCGFWDGDWDEDMGARLSEWCRKQSETQLYFGEDGFIYIFGKEDYISD
jgi:hypothetical protein